MDAIRSRIKTVTLYGNSSLFSSSGIFPMNLPLMGSYLSLMDSQLIVSCYFSVLKSVYNKFPSSTIFIFFFGGIIAVLHSVFKNNKESLMFFLKSHNQHFNIFLLLRIAQSVFKLVNTLAFFYVFIAIRYSLRNPQK